MAIAFGIPSRAQQVSLFQSITTRDGLPSNYVFDAEEDSDGFLWIGTDKGLARYDGYRWQLLTTDNGLPGNYITELYSDGNRGLWLLISTKGLYHFNTITRASTFVTNRNLDHLLQADDKGGLFFYQHRQPGATPLLDGCYVHAASPQTIRVAFREGESRWRDLLITDFRRRKVIVKPTADHRIPIDRVRDLAPGWTLDTLDLPGLKSLILNPVDKGLYASNQSLFFVSRGRMTRNLPLSVPENTYLNTTRYQGQTVACNEKNGVYMIGDDGNWKHYTEKEGLASNLVSRAHVLKNGKLLLCTLGGGLSYKLPEGNATIDTKGLPVKGLAQNGKGLYAAVGNSLLRYNGEDGSVRSFALPEKNIQSVDVVGPDIYVSTMTGYGVYRVAGERLARKNNLIRFAGISNVIKSGDRIFAGTYGNHVLEIGNGKVREDSNSFFVSEKVQPFRNGYAAFNYEDGIQLNYFDGRRKQFNVQNGLPSNAVYHVHEKDDTLWVSTRSGIGAISNGKVVKTITSKEGLHGERCIFSFHDTQGNFWIVTDQYLGKYDGRMVYTYSSVPVKDGMHDAVTHCLYQRQTNTLFTGTLRSIFLTELDNLRSGTAAEAPQVQDIRVNGMPVKENRFRIPHNYLSLEFSFAPVSANPFALARLYYKLQGADEQYQLVKDSLTIHFNNLRSGRYTLLAKVKNEEGVESGERALLTFTVARPLWQEGWFIALAVAIAASGAYFFAVSTQKRKQRQKEKERMLEAQLANERERISRELHDNLGTSLVTMIAQSDNIETRLRLQQTDEALKKAMELGDQSRETMNVLRETIWAVQENAHSWESFISRIREFLQRTYAVTNIDWACQVEGQPVHYLTPEQTLNLFRCVQECTQNIIKHSGAGKATYAFIVQDGQLHISIKDDGRGFDSTRHFTSNGLKNMQKRVEELKGAFGLVSSPSAGTTVTIQTAL